MKIEKHSRERRAERDTFIPTDLLLLQLPTWNFWYHPSSVYHLHTLILHQPSEWWRFTQKLHLNIIIFINKKNNNNCDPSCRIFQLKRTYYNPVQTAWHRRQDEYTQHSNFSKRHLFQQNLTSLREKIDSLL